MQCKEVESVIEQEGLELLPDSARAHLATCDSCRDFVADLSSIVTAAHELPAEVEAPARVWVSLRNQLEAEGIIRTPAVPAALVRSTPWWQSVAKIFRGRALVATAAGIAIAFFAGMQATRHQTLAPARTATASVAAPGAPAPAPAGAGVVSSATAKSKAPASRPPVTALPQVPAPPAALDFGEHDLANMRMAGTAASNNSSAVVDTSLQDSLKQVDAFIAECEKHLQDNPHDELAREYLSAAYHQKAELISVMLDRGRSVN
ncbi:MAG TPA: hypothetical protein VK525_21025 [Candidatus Saccharimonadales bacterium]|nr:hypothetical protein [Candidatus Saccharimonadales bacterium]